MKKIAIIYHGDCPDGFGAAWAAWKKFGAKAEYYGVLHGDPPLALKNKTVFFLDLIYEDEDALKTLQYNNEKVTAIDHHVSTKKLVEFTEDYVYAANHSGAVLAWRYFHPRKPVPRVLLYIEDMDIWKLKLPHTREIRSNIQLLPFDFKIWDKFIRRFENASFRREAVEKGKLLRIYETRSVQRIIQNSANLVNFLGHKVYAVNSPLWSDEFGHAIYQKFPPFAIIWKISGKRIKVSLRGNGKVDLSKLAGKFGGGGHRDASGFTVPLAKGAPWKIIDE